MNVCDFRSNTILHIATSSGKIALVKFLVNELKLSYNDLNMDGESPLVLSQKLTQPGIFEFFNSLDKQKYSNAEENIRALIEEDNNKKAKKNKNKKKKDTQIDGIIGSSEFEVNLKIPEKKKVEVVSTTNTLLSKVEEENIENKTTTEAKNDDDFSNFDDDYDEDYYEEENEVKDTKFQPSSTVNSSLNYKSSNFGSNNKKYQKNEYYSNNTYNEYNSYDNYSGKHYDNFGSKGGYNNYKKGNYNKQYNNYYSNNQDNSGNYYPKRNSNKFLDKKSDFDEKNVCKIHIFNIKILTK